MRKGTIIGLAMTRFHSTNYNVTSHPKRMDNVVCFLFVVTYYTELPSFLTTHLLSCLGVRNFPADVGVVINFFDGAGKCE